MPRPKKCRKVCQMPRIREFYPAGRACCNPAVVLTVDEYEAIRLIDRQGFSQEECSAYMQGGQNDGSARFTILPEKSWQTALVDGLPLRIEGGDYQLCDGEEAYCGCGGCKRHRHGLRTKGIKEDGTE